MEFIEAPLFTQLAEYLSDDGYRMLQLHLARDPEAGASSLGLADSESSAGRIAGETKGNVAA